MNLAELVYASVCNYGDKECIRFKRDGVYQSRTYRQFWDDVMHFAAGLMDCGIHPGDKVAILANNGPEWAISDCSILALGAVVVPIYPTLPPDQVEFILHNADVTAIIVEDDEQLQKVLSVWPEHLRGAVVMKTNPSEQPEHVVGRWIHPFVSVVGRGAQVKHKTAIPFDEIPADQLATIVHTSGTSGRPKGVMLTHHNIVSNVTASLSMIPVRSDDIGLSYLPLSHIFERTIGQFVAFHNGAAIAYAERIETIPQNLKEVRPTLLVTVPRLLEKVYTQVLAKVEHAPKPLRSVLQRGLNQSSRTGFAYRLVDMLVYRKIRAGLGGRMRLIVSGGAALAPHIAEFYEKAGIPIHQGYGMTETSPVIATNPLGGNRIGTVGKVIPGVEVRLAEDGELLVRGPNVMLGYYGDPEETAKCLVDGWLHTGDIAELSDGYVTIIDRKKNIMVLATGKNVAPAPIENALVLSPYISSAVLVGDGRKYVTCILAPDVETLRPLATELGLGDDVESWVRHPEIRKRVAVDVARLTSAFAPFEQPKRAALLPYELTLESGDLTPTLKVKTKVLMEKYGAYVESMYAGTDYIPIPGGHHDESDDPHEPLADSANPAMPFSASSHPGERSMEPVAAAQNARRRNLWMTAAGVLVLAGGGVTALAAGHHLPDNLNVLGMVQHIHQNNQKINNVNGEIVGNLKSIDSLAAATATIGQDLHTLKDGTVQDDAFLGTLNQLSQQEIDLSQSFNSLAQTLQSDMGRISSASSQQDGTVSAMVQQAGQLHAAASQMGQINQTVAQKLTEADQRTRTIASEMP